MQRTIRAFAPVVLDFNMLASHSTFLHLRVPIFVSKRRARVCMAIATTSSSSSSSSSLSSELAPYTEHVKRCNRGKEERSSFVPFLVDNVSVGFIHPSFLQHLKSFPKVFSVVRERFDLRDSFVTLHDDLKTQEDRTESINTSLKVLSEDGVIPGWRNEMYPVVNSFGATPFFSLERAAVPYFGTKHSMRKYPCEMAKC